MSEATSLEIRQLGRTGLPVTVLGYGAMALDGERMAPRGLTISDSDAAQVLNAVLDAGINFIDTSPDYGESEELIGQYISHRRGEYFLASKAGCLVHPSVAGGGMRHVYSPENIRAAVERSLSRMKTDHLDLVQFHGSPSEEEEGEAIATLLHLKKQGMVRFIGASATLPRLAQEIDLGDYDAFQIPYSVLQREHEEEIGRAANLGFGTIIRGGVARGAPAEDKDWNQRLPDLSQSTVDRGLEDAWSAAKLDELLDGESRVGFTLRFAMAHPGVHTVIVGTGKLAHLQDNIATAKKGPLPAEVFAETVRRLDAVNGA